MAEIFIKAIEKLSDPIAILALLLMVCVLFLVRAVTRHLPELNRTLGRQATILEHLIYDVNDQKVRGNEQRQD